MPGFFDAAANFKQPAKKPITATIAGTVITVTLEQKKEIMLSGEDAWMLKDGQLVKKPMPTVKKGYKRLIKSDMGYNFYDNNPYWPKEIVEGGHTWQTPSE